MGRNKFQQSKKSRHHKKQAKEAGIYVNTSHPSHLSDWRRSTNSIVIKMDQHGNGNTALYHSDSLTTEELGISNSVNIKKLNKKGGDN